MLACISSVLPLPVAHPEGELVELRPGLGRFVEAARSGRPRACRRCRRRSAAFSAVEQRLRVAEVAVEVDLGEEQRQVLEVLPDDRLFAARDAPLVQPQRVPDDVLVVLQQQLGRQLRQVEELRRERVVEAMDVVLVQPLQRLVAQMLGQLLEALDVEERQQPLVEHQLVGERHLGRCWRACGPAALRSRRPSAS